MLRAIAAALFLLFAAPAFAQQGSPVSGVPTPRSTVTSSAVIATGNTFQSVLASTTGTQTRQALTIENNNASDNCWIFFGATGSATKGTSILLLPGGSYSRYWPYVPSDNIAATCATTSDTLYIDNN